MQAFIEFIQAYWQYISFGILIFIEVLLIILKKKPITLDVFLDAVRQCICNLPKMINHVERPGDGEDKKDEVIDFCVDFVSDILNRNLTAEEVNYVVNVCSDHIEKVLSTPQKKGARYESES